MSFGDKKLRDLVRDRDVLLDHIRDIGNMLRADSNRWRLTFLEIGQVQCMLGSVVGAKPSGKLIGMPPCVGAMLPSALSAYRDQLAAELRVVEDEIMAGKWREAEVL